MWKQRRKEFGNSKAVAIEAYTDNYLVMLDAWNKYGKAVVLV